MVSRNDLVSSMDANTDPSRVPSVKAVRTYIANNKFANVEEYKLYGEYTTQADVYGFYPYRDYTTTGVSLPKMGSTLIYI